MTRVISIGKQDFASLREHDYFFVDKTKLIREWWESGDEITLITRPRRFGKTLNMSMLHCFFSNHYADRADLFEGLDIWKYETYRQLQGTYPVLFLSFASVKADNLSDAKKQINALIAKKYEENRFLLQKTTLSENEKQAYEQVTMEMEDARASSALNDLCCYLNRFYEKKVIVLLDEYDTPLQEAWLKGYWDGFVSYIRSLFNAVFKTNPYLERAVMTGITRISKESVFSDLNNLNVVTTTSEEYADCFGFTEKEVFEALETYGLSDQQKQVKKWYDGFIFGHCRDIYNPWSITNYLDKKQFRPYWAATSSNALVNRLIQTSSADVKQKMEQLISGREISVTFDEQIVYDQLDQDERAIWSLLLAGGYLKADNIEYRGDFLEPWYSLKITNQETYGMFAAMFKGWFGRSLSSYNGFIQALLSGNTKEMNAYMNDIALMTFSFFDTGKHPSEKMQPERFYHGFVLGLLVELRGRYRIESNGESGYGRYDIMMTPLQKAEDAILIEFKVHDPEEEQTLADTVQAALRQIREKRYDAKLKAAGFSEDKIRSYGFAFEGKKVLIGSSGAQK